MTYRDILIPLQCKHREDSSHAIQRQLYQQHVPTTHPGDLTNLNDSGTSRGHAIQPPLGRPTSHHQYVSTTRPSDLTGLNDSGTSTGHVMQDDSLTLLSHVEAIYSLDIIQRNIVASHCYGLVCKYDKFKMTECMWKTPVEDSTDFTFAAYYSSLGGIDLVDPLKAVPDSGHEIDISKLPPHWKDRVKRCRIAIPKTGPGVDSTLMDWIIYFRVDESFLSGLELTVRRHETTPNWSV
jgi:hypothetical protein